MRQMEVVTRRALPVHIGDPSIYPARNFVPRKVRVFLDYLKDKFKTGPPEDAWFIILYFRIVEGWVEVQNQHNRLGSTQPTDFSFRL